MRQIGEMTQVLNPRTQWAKNRIREHGNWLRVRQMGNALRPNAIMLECLTCGWAGWFHDEATFGFTIMVPVTTCQRTILDD